MSDDLNNRSQAGDRQSRANAYANASRTQRQAASKPMGAAPQGSVPSSVVTTVPSSSQRPSAKRPTASNRPSSAKASGAGAARAGKDAGAKGSGVASGASAVAKNGKRNIGKIAVIVAIVVVACIAVGAAGVWWFSSESQNFYDAAATEGQAPYKTDEEIQAELNRVVSEGMLNISIASVIEFPDGTSPGVAYIENVPSNKYVMRVDIKLDDTDETVYQSGGIQPNHYIESIRLSKDLDAGSYPAVATFTAYDPETLDEVGQAAAKVTLEIEN